ncbi:HD domain-containing protein [Ruminococcus sp. OA3]|uniref:HD domain-containing response regulator n=1 Tax=Ruminococcus sp. OA3 TaxID=2914164 RepID=UPI001F063D2C|nr:HD domain-containing response regulator [Ruminococcus sp. OA3]MCH1982656.1 HD domain-containing protein [Ruminococcus sp. OA3]
MRRSRGTVHKNISILTLDDDAIMTSTLQAYFQRSGYDVDVENDPYRAIERVRDGEYDILLLDFLMSPVCGDQVVEQIRSFNRDIYIILLTGHKSMAPPLKTIRELEIQGYYEKSDRFDQLELLVESCVKSILQMRTIQNYKNGLSLMMDVLPQIYDLDATQSVFGSILEAAMRIFQAESSFIVLNEMPYRVVEGNIQKTTGTISDAEITEIIRDAEFGEKLTLQKGEYLLAAIENEKHQAIGILGIGLKNKTEYVQVQLMEIFARQISSALHNNQLHLLVSEQNKELTRAYAQLNESYMEIIGAMRTIVDERDIYTRGHSDRVSCLAEALARQMGKDKKFIERVKLAGLFHDIGKVGISDRILLKPEKLSFEEYADIKKHSDKGAKILAAITLFSDIVPIVHAHHERIDGKGYPDGLKGDEIPDESKIIAVADSFDAMTSHRQYRSNMTLGQAIEELKKGSGTQFAPEVVEAFLQLCEECGQDKFFDMYAVKEERL